MNTNYKTIILAISLFFALSSLAFAHAGDLDPTFGTGGKVITVLPNDNRPHKMAVQPDGKIIGQGGWYSGSDLSFLVRYNPNGTLDNSFGNDGIVLIPSSSLERFTNGLELLPDGKILVSGETSTNGLAVFRFNGNGSRDASFGINGVAVAQVGSDLNYSRTLTVQPDGKIITVGDLCECINEYDPVGIGVARFNANGSLDTTFGAGGTLIISANPDSFVVSDSAVLPEGKLLLIGYNYFASQQIFLSRINPNGTLDASFGTNGILVLEFAQAENFVSQFALELDGKIVFSTENYSENYQTTTIVRLNPNGTYDASFGTNGKVLIPESEGIFSRAVLLQPDGKILAGGSVQSGFGILRLNPNGSRDTSFGTNGIVSTFLASYLNSVADLALQPDGKLIAYGIITDGPPVAYDIGLARYVLDSPPTRFDFDGDGRADISVFRPSDRVWYLNRSTQGFSATQFGLSSDKITPTDYDGDGKTDIAVYRGGVWYRLNSSNQTVGITQFGLVDDVPVPADFDGDGRAELAVYRNGVWWSLNLANNQVGVTQFGLSNDKPVPADYDGDGRTDQAIYRNGEWHLNRSLQGYTVVNFGLSTDKPVVGDYDGDGKTDQAVYREGVWYLLQSSQGFAAFPFGISTDTPAPADYDGDGKTDAAVFRDGVWYLRQTTGGISIQQFGLPNDKPISSAFLP